MGFVLIQFVSTLLGVVASLTAWTILFHVLRPRVEFSRGISRLPVDEEEGGYAYRVKLRNAARRAIIDVTYRAKLRIQGLNPSRPHNFEVTYLPVSFDGYIPLIKGRDKYHFVRIKTDRPEEFSRAIYPTGIRTKAAQRTLTLEDLLALGTEASVQIIGFGSDAFSGTRRELISPEYTLPSITTRPFRHKSLELADEPTDVLEAEPDEGSA